MRFKDIIWELIKLFLLFSLVIPIFIVYAFFVPPICLCGHCNYGIMLLNALIFIFSSLFFCLLSKKFYKEIEIGLILSIIVALMGIYIGQLTTVDCAPSNIVTRNWDKMQPLVPTITYSTPEGTFTAAFNNVEGTSVKLTNITVTETYTNTNCTAILVGDGGVGQAIGTGYTVAPGSAFKMTASNCSNKTRGDQYLMNIVINFKEVVGGINTNHTEIGIIEGNAE